MGHEHLKNLALLRQLTQFEPDVVALIDPDRTMRESAQALAKELGFSQARTYASLDDVDTDAIDAFVVVSPNHTHFAVLNRLIATGKAILAEKPLCTTVADCDAVLSLLEGHAAPFWVAMEYRYMPATMRFLERLNSGDVGDLKMLSIREQRYPFLAKVGDWNRFSENTGGTLVEKCCHHFDLMRLITGSEAVRVFASGAIKEMFRAWCSVHAISRLLTLMNPIYLPRLKPLAIITGQRISNIVRLRMQSLTALPWQ